MPRRPLVTVLLSAYNDLRFLPQAVESVLAQTFADFEFLVIDDGSTDGSRDYLERLRDCRIRVLRNPANVGLTCSLNRGLNAATGRLVARMDADDVALPERLARQVEFLRGRPEVGIVGSSRALIDEAGKFIAHAPAEQDDLRVRWKCLLGNPFAHPTVMIRLHVVEEHGMRYDETFHTAQDYELWTRLLTVTRGANLPEPLVQYRLREGVSRTLKAEQVANHDRIAYEAINRLLPSFKIKEDEVPPLRGRFGGQSVRDPGMDPDDAHWRQKYRQMREAFIAAHGGEAGALAA